MNSILILVICGLMVCGFLARYLSNVGDLTPSPDGEGWGEENSKHWLSFLLKGVATATDVLMSVRGPTAAILSFASPKESIQRKDDPDAACILRSEAFGEGFRKGHPWPSENERPPCRSPIGLFSPKAPVLGAAYGRNISQ